MNTFTEQKARKRTNPYVYVTWLAKLMGGQDQCRWKYWFKANFQFKKPQDSPEKQAFLDGYLAKHSSLVNRRALDLEDEGYKVYVEGENSFTMAGSTGITVGGRPDIIAVRDEEVLVVDCKSGEEKPSDKLQTLIYMYLVPFSLGHCKNRTRSSKVSSVNWSC